MFQFQTGSIKSKQWWMYDDPEVSFNSKLVRLKDENTALKRVYHYSFNSKLVRLKGIRLP